MKVTLIGGMDRLKRHYEEAAHRAGHDLKIFFQYETGMEAKIGTTDALVLFTGKVSHSARNHALEAARNLGIPVIQSHSSGISALRECLLSVGNF